MEKIACLQTTSMLPVILFAIGAVTSTIAVARHNAFTVKQAIMAALGLIGFRSTLPINLLIAATLIIPLGLWAWLISDCAPPLHNAPTGS